VALPDRAKARFWGWQMPPFPPACALGEGAAADGVDGSSLTGAAGLPFTAGAVESVIAGLETWLAGEPVLAEAQPPAARQQWFRFIAGCGCQHPTWRTSAARTVSQPVTTAIVSTGADQG
jgi:hypothetical protein